MRKLIFPCFFLFLFLFSVTAYEHIGGDNRDYYYLNQSGFNSNVNISSYYRYTLDENPAFDSVLVGDFDNDGETEIFAQSCTGLTTNECYLYMFNPDLTIEAKTLMQNRDLDAGATKSVVDGFTHVYSIDTLDYNNDGLTEFVMVGWHPSLNHIAVNTYWYNGSGFEFDNETFENDLASIYADKIAVACSDTEDVCMLLSTAEEKANDVRADLNIQWYNITNIGTVNLIQPNSLTNRFCTHHWGGVTVGDYDDDGNDDFIISYIDFSESGNEVLRIKVYSWNGGLSSFNSRLNISVTLDNHADFTDGGDKCSSVNAPYRITNLIVADLDKVFSNQNELLIGVTRDDSCGGTQGTWSNRIYMFDYLGNEIDDFPEVEFCGGNEMGNLYLSDWYERQKGFGLQQYDGSDGDIFELAASDFKPSGALGTSDYIFYKYEIPYNITGNSFKYLTTHSIESNTSLYSEFLNIYGTYVNLDINNIWSQGNTNFARMWDMESETTLIPISVDVDGDGYADVVALDGSTIRVWSSSPKKYGCDEQPLDARYEGCHGDITICPRVDRAWLQNTTLSVQTDLYDYDSGKLQVNIEWYADSEDVQNTTWQGNFSSGDSPLINSYSDVTFKANVTGSNHKLRISIHDLDKPLQITTITEHIGVSETSGATYSDSECTTISGTTPDIGLIDITETPIGDNMFVTAAGTIATAGGLSIESYYLLIVVMLGIAIFATTLSKSTPVMAGGFAIGGMMFATLIGAIFGMLNVAWVLVPVVFGVGGYFMFKFIFDRS